MTDKTTTERPTPHRHRDEAPRIRLEGPGDARIQGVHKHERLEPRSGTRQPTNDVVFVTIAGDGTIEPSTDGQSTGWQESFARHHRIRFNHVGDLTVSTVFLGIAHRSGDGSLTAAFETTIFEVDGLAQESWRWSTLQEARSGHAWVLEDAQGRL